MPHRLAIALILLTTVAAHAQYSRKTVVAHRGASAYAPEHTAAAYRLAIEMGADFVEQDLAVTRDNVLICLHDASLERTTNVEEVFPDRGITISLDGSTRRHWVANDFTLAEVKRLDAGSWFDRKFANEKILTFTRDATSTSSNWSPRRSISTACAGRMPIRRRR
jgi:glycerophosphoryl diester phosphodiesterase